MLEPTHSSAQFTQLRHRNRFMQEAEDGYNTQQTVQKAEQSLLFETSNICEQIV